MGNITELQYMSRRNTKQTVQMLDKDHLLVINTGEVKDVQHGTSRKDCMKNLYKTFANARGLINANVVDTKKVRWCTLTYAENMTDTKRLYRDFQAFNQRFQYYLEKNNLGKAEYIVMMEPQGRGAWHAHLLYIWTDREAPFIPNKTFAELWRHGFVKIKKLQDVDNVGAYLTAYLGDMEFEETKKGLMTGAFDSDDLRVQSVVEKEVLDDDGTLKKKKFLKGARLRLYPVGFNMIRYSKGIIKPEVEMMSLREAEKKVLAATKTYESALRLTDAETHFETLIVKRQYNSIRKTIQDD